MSYRVLVERAASKSLAELPFRVQNQLVERLLSLESDPYRQSRKLGVYGVLVIDETFIAKE